MAIVRNLFFLFAFTVFAITSTILTIYNYNPYQSNFSVFADFYGSILVAIAGIVSIAVYYIRIRISESEDAGRYFWSSCREGILISTGVTTILVLRGLRILDWLIGLSIIVVVILLELFFQTKKHKVS